MTATGWETRVACSPNGSAGFELGPAQAPMGYGSARFTVTDNLAQPEFRNFNYDGVRIASLTELSYFTYTDDHRNPAAAIPYLVLNVDQAWPTADGMDDGVLVFQPVYQQPGYTTNDSPNAPTQARPATGVWQEWDAFAGVWRYTRYDGQPTDLGSGREGEASSYHTLDAFLGEFPDATIENPNLGSVESPDVHGGFRMVAGCGTGPFESNGDALSIRRETAPGVFDRDIYDFEA